MSRPLTPEELELLEKNRAAPTAPAAAQTGGYYPMVMGLLNQANEIFAGRNSNGMPMAPPMTQVGPAVAGGIYPTQRPPAAPTGRAAGGLNNQMRRAGMAEPKFPQGTTINVTGGNVRFQMPGDGSVKRPSWWDEEEEKKRLAARRRR